MSTVIAVALVLILAIHSDAYPKNRPPEVMSFSRQVRIHLGERDSLSVNSSGEIIIECYREGKRAELYYTSSLIKAVRTKDGLMIKDNNGILAIELSAVIFKPRFPNVYLDFENKQYKGFIECDDGQAKSPIRVFNMIDIEQYIKGVLPGEIGDRPETDYEALKAQAIAARTYAIWRLSTQNDGDKHLMNSIDDQLYLGYSKELPLLNKAVEETEGVIMTYNGEPIAAYYHAVCGGSTSPVNEVWDAPASPYLVGIADSNYCQWAKTYNWNETYSIEKLSLNLTDYFAKKNKLPKKGLGKILSIDFIRDDAIGRMVELRIKTTTGEFKVAKDQIRWALKRSNGNGSILPSTRFNANVIKSGDTITKLELIGAGNGHGIGMCQCGAIGRAQNGQTVEQILNAYYKDIIIERIY